MKRIRVLGAISWVLISINLLQGKEWKSIVPLLSTEADVERILGKPEGAGLYKFENEKAYVHYIDTVCKDKNNCLCLVPKGTVQSIYVILEDIRQFSTLSIDKSKFIRHKFSDSPIMATYSNYEEGIIYTVDESEDDITAIEFLHSSQDCEKMLSLRNKPKTILELVSKESHCGFLHF